MRANKQLTRVTCAGIVDADGQTADDVKYLNERGVYHLPVSEVENLFLLPDVSRAIARMNHYAGPDVEHQLKKLSAAVFARLKSPAEINEVVMRYCRRRIDRTLKRIDLSDAKDVASLAAEYSSLTAELDVAALAAAATAEVQSAVASNDLAVLLRIYDNKGLLSDAALHLMQTRRNSFEAWITRVLRAKESTTDLAAALGAVLPKMQAA